MHNATLQSVSLWEVGGQPVFAVRASSMAAQAGERQYWMRCLSEGALGRISSFVVVLEDLDALDAFGFHSFSLGCFDRRRGVFEFGQRAAIDASASLAFAAAAAGEWQQLQLPSSAAAAARLVLLNTQERFEVDQIAGSVRTTRRPGKPASAGGNVLPTGQTSHRLASGIEVSIVDCGQPVLVVRAEAIGASGREEPGKRLKSGLSALQWDELYDEVSGLLDPNDAQEVSLLGLERARDLPLVWVAVPGKEIDRMDCTMRMSLDGRQVHAVNGQVQLSLVAAAAIPGTVLQQVTRTLPGLDCRLGLEERILVASADVQGPSGQGRRAMPWQLQSLSMHQSARCLFRGVCPLPAANGH